MFHFKKLSIAIFVAGVTNNATTKALGSFLFNIQQEGFAVVVTGSGTLNLSALAFSNNATSPGANIGPSLALLSAGPVSNVPLPYSAFSGISGPTSFGTTPRDFGANFGSGDNVGVGLGTTVSVPVGYISNAPLSDAATFSNSSFSTLGLIPGVYVYTWGSGPTADSLTINIGVVPEPASLAVIGVPAAFALLRRRLKR